MKILFLSQRFLFPMDTGGKKRTGNVLKHLAKMHDITLFSNVEFPKDHSYLAQTKDLCTHFIPVPWEEMKRYSLLFWLRLFFQMFSIYPVSALNDCSKSLQIALKKELLAGKYDLAICDFVQSAKNFKWVKNVPSVLFQHNVESIILSRHMATVQNPISFLFWWFQWKKMVRFEKKACRAFDRIIAVSQKDKKDFERLYALQNVEAIQTGVDTEYFKPCPHIPEKEHSLAFCGSMDWLPNEDAILFFIEEIFPVVKKRVKDVTLTVVGRNPSPYLKKEADKFPEISLTGWVEDIRPYIAESSVFIVPIRIGGGTRMKIYEAMAMGKPVISTSVGAEGLSVQNQKNIIIEDEAEELAGKIVYLFDKKEDRERMGGKASAHVRENFSWKKVTEEFERICTETASGSTFSAERK